MQYCCVTTFPIIKVFRTLRTGTGLCGGRSRKAGMPYVALIGNKTDLNHMRTVKPEKHSAFAEENDMYSYTMSAKTGDQVNACFYRIAADLAGVVLTKPEVQVAQQCVRAEHVHG